MEPGIPSSRHRKGCAGCFAGQERWELERRETGGIQPMRRMFLTTEDQQRDAPFPPPSNKLGGPPVA